MTVYHAPVQDMQFVMQEIAGLAEIAILRGFEEATPDLASAVLDEADRFVSSVLATLNSVGDREGCRLV